MSPARQFTYGLVVFGVAVAVLSAIWFLVFLAVTGVL